jgi:RNA polymerase sigma-70 factor, ECF subfamily
VDRDFLEQFRAGEESAVKSVYERYGGPVYSVALRILQDHALAADATQQTFINAWRGAGGFDPDRDFAPWLYTIARRCAIDIYRKQTRSLTDDRIDTPVLDPSFDAIWEIFEVRSALEQLSDEERQVIKMSHFDGLTHVEIAQHLGIPLGTVKSRSHRAHRRLLDLLAHLEEKWSP